MYPHKNRSIQDRSWANFDDTHDWGGNKAGVSPGMYPGHNIV